MEALSKVLSNNIDIVEEIGWDIPDMVLPYLNLDWDLDESSEVGSSAMKSVMSVFDLLAKHGNAKELFVKSIELLTNLDYSQNDTPRNEKLLDVKFYTLLELLASTLKRINTIYPSKFLAMALSCCLTSFIKYTDFNPRQRFITRKVYAFARDYIPPLKPLDWLKEHGITQEEAHKLDDDEAYLQRKLLQSFLTQICGLSFRTHGLGFSQQLYVETKLNEHGKMPIWAENEDLNISTREAFSRIVGLAMSFDIDLDEEFEKLKKDSSLLMEKANDIIKDVKPDSDETQQDQLVQATVGLCLNDRLATTFNPAQTVLPLSPAGLFNICTQYNAEQKSHGHTPHELTATLHEAIAMYIRFLTPGLVSSKLHTKGLVDSALYWVWGAVATATREDWTSLPKHLRILFLQTTVHFSCVDEEQVFRFILFMLLVRALANFEEGFAYDFIVDTLTTAPLETAKAGVVNVLKDFLIRERPVVTVDELSEELKRTSVSDGNATNDSAPAAKPAPALPKRHMIELTSDRIDDIYALIRECLDDAFADEVIDGARFKTLLGYLNLLIGIKERFPQDKLSEIVNQTKKKLDQNKKCEDSSTNVEFANVAIESLTEYIRQKKQSP